MILASHQCTCFAQTYATNTMLLTNFILHRQLDKVYNLKLLEFTYISCSVYSKYHFAFFYFHAQNAFLFWHFYFHTQNTSLFWHLKHIFILTPQTHFYFDTSNTFLFSHREHSFLANTMNSGNNYLAHWLCTHNPVYIGWIIAILFGYCHVLLLIIGIHNDMNYDLDRWDDNNLTSVLIKHLFGGHWNAYSVDYKSVTKVHNSLVVYRLCILRTVETRYSTIYYSKYFIELNLDKSTQYVALWTHKRHPIPRPLGRAMECLLWVFQQKLIVL